MGDFLDGAPSDSPLDTGGKLPHINKSDFNKRVHVTQGSDTEGHISRGVEAALTNGT